MKPGTGRLLQIPDDNLEVGLQRGESGKCKEIGARIKCKDVYIYFAFLSFFFFFFLLQSTGVLFETNTKQASPHIYPPKKNFQFQKSRSDSQLEVR